MLKDENDQVGESSRSSMLPDPGEKIQVGPLRFVTGWVYCVRECFDVSPTVLATSLSLSCMKGFQSHATERLRLGNFFRWARFSVEQLLRDQVLVQCESRDSTRGRPGLDK